MLLFLVSGEGLQRCLDLSRLNLTIISVALQKMDELIQEMRDLMMTYASSK